MSNKIDTKGKTLAQILRMRAEVQDRAEAKIDELTRARAEAFRRAEAEALPKMDEIVGPIVDREMESTAPLQAEADAAAAEADALDDVIGPHLESGKVALFFPAEVQDRPDGLMAAFLDEDGDVTIAPTFGASTVLADDPPVSPPKRQAADDGGPSAALMDKVADALRKALGVEVTRVDIDPATGGLVCHCPGCEARRAAEAKTEAAETSHVVEDQASS